MGPGTLQLGLNGEFQHKTLDSYWATTTGPDPSIPTTTSTDYVFDAGFGALFHTDLAHVGVGITHLLESEYDDLNITGARHYYAHGGYRYNFTPTFGIEPMFLYKTDAVADQIDVVLRAHFMDFLVIGTGYRNQDAYVFMLGYESDHFRIGYSYDLITSQISDYASGSHEFLVSFLIE
jgi:type IX secretion system PorP/SprF family membrane protein